MVGITPVAADVGARSTSGTDAYGPVLHRDRLLDVRSDGTTTSSEFHTWTATTFDARADFDGDGAGDVCGVDYDIAAFFENDLDVTCRFGGDGGLGGELEFPLGEFSQGMISDPSDPVVSAADVGDDGRDEIVLVTAKDNSASVQVDVIGLDPQGDIAHVRDTLQQPQGRRGAPDALAVGEFVRTQGEPNFPDLLIDIDGRLLLGRGGADGFADLEPVGNLDTGRFRFNYDFVALAGDAPTDRLVMAYRGTQRVHLWDIPIAADTGAVGEPSRIGGLPGHRRSWIRPVTSAMDHDGDGVQELAMLYRPKSSQVAGWLWKWELGTPGDNGDGPERIVRLSGLGRTSANRAL